MNRWLAYLLLVGCAAPPAARVETAPRVEASVSPVPVPSPAAVCRKRDANQARLLEEMVSWRDHPDGGAYRKEHADFYRYFPTLHESGQLESIAMTHAKDGDRPIFALTMLVRNARGGADTRLGFAAMPCPDGDLALIGPLTSLDVETASIRWNRHVPNAPELTELELEVSAAVPAGSGQPRPVVRTRSVVVGAKPGAKIAVLGSVDVDGELPAKDGVARADRHLFGSGWYAHRGGASYLLVHRVTYSKDDLCKQNKKEYPASPPMLRLLAHVDAKSGWAADPAAVGGGFVVAVGEHPAPEAMYADKEFTTRTGPTSLGDEYVDHGPPAQSLFGIFDSADAATARVRSFKYTKGTILATEPKEPFTLAVPKKKGPSLACDDFR